MLNITYITINSQMYPSDKDYYVCVLSYLVIETYFVLSLVRPHVLLLITQQYILYYCT
jgi:hypothetical protein